jgi:hypothetical protein
MPIEQNRDGKAAIGPKEEGDRPEIRLSSVYRKRQFLMAEEYK